MKLAWKNICKNNPDKEADLKAALADGHNAFTFLSEILEQRVASSMNEMLLDSYEKTKWELKQADIIGELRAYKEISNLIKSTLDTK